MISPLARACRFAVFLAVATSATAQVAVQDTGTFATAAIDDARCVFVDGSGTIFVAGASSVPGSTAGSAYIAAWSASGTLLWSTTYNASPGGLERPSAVASDNAGGVYVAGAAANTVVNQWRAFLLRVDATGAITWSIERAPTTVPEWAPALVVDANGRAILGGRVQSTTGDFSIAAYTPIGALDWEFALDSGYFPPDQITDLALAPNGDIVGGGTISVGSGPHPAILRVSASGQLRHYTPISNPDVTSGTAAALVVDSGDRVFLASSSTGTSHAVTALALTALDAQGVPLWTRAIQGPQQPWGAGAGATDVALDPYGRPIVLGWSAQGSQGIATVVVAHDRDGNEAWRSVVNDVLGGASTNLWNLPSRLVMSGEGEAIAVGLYGPPLADTVADAYVLGFDATGDRRFGFTNGFPPTAGGSYDVAGGVAASPGSGFVLVGRAQTSASSSGVDAFYARFARTAVGFCFGDGAGAACPCGNASQPVERAGCAASLGTGGRLADLGASSLANDTLALIGSAMPNSSALYFQGTGALPGSAFGDGLRCVGGSIVRLGLKTNSAGTSRYPDSGEVPVAQRGLVTAPGDRTYQVWYRNAAAFCTSATFNLSNGLRVTWTP